MTVEALCKKLTECYPTHATAPGLQIAWVKDGKKEGYYVGIHLFPNGINSRTVVAKAIESTVELAATKAHDIWVAIVKKVQEDAAQQA